MSVANASDRLHAALMRANRRHVATAPRRGHLSEEATHHYAILTCMDARIEPEHLMGLHRGDAYILRNAGGRASDDMIRSLVLVTRLFQATHYAIVHHTDCGMEKVDDPEVRHLLRKSLGPCRLHEPCKREPDNRDGGHESDYVAFLAFEDLERSVIDDVRRVRYHPLVSRHVAIRGYVLDIETGRLHEVEAASRIGRPLRAVRPGRECDEAIDRESGE